MQVFAEFLAKIDNPDHRIQMEEVLNWVAEQYPQLVPEVKWNQPMFTNHGTYIIGFSVAKQHMSVAPEQAGMKQFAQEIKEAGFSHTKELVRMPWDKPFDFSLLGKMIVFNIEDKADYPNFWRSVKN